MLEFLEQLFDTSGFPPRWQCGAWTPGHGWLHIVADLGVWSAYVAIPCVLGYFVLRRRDLPFRTIFWLFGAFILACGTTHLMEVLLFWWPAYRLAGLIKLFTAIVSWGTVLALIPATPRVLAMRSPEELQREIAQRKKAEIALQEKNVEMERANEAKDLFLATMSHELRTPLNAVIGFTGTLLMRLPGPLNAVQEKQLTMVQGSAKHLLSLINDLLDLAKIESGKVELHPEPVACRDLVQEVIAALRPQAEAKGLSLDTGVAPPDLVVQADRRALSQILLNLAGNAVKFTEKGNIRLDVRRREENGAARTEFAVADTGVGIQEVDQAMLFQAFTQVGAPRKRRAEGTGLGLHLSQKLAELLGGRITFQSEFGRGSTFTLALTGNKP
jgi:signal transduction histidine kinase